MSVAQGPFRFEVERDTRPNGLTSYAGLPLFVETARVLGMAESVEQHLGGAKNAQAYSPWEVLEGSLSAVAIGAKSIEDVARLGWDQGFLRVTEKTRFPSDSTFWRFYDSAHELPTRQGGVLGKAVLPEESRVLRGLECVVRE